MKNTDHIISLISKIRDKANNLIIRELKKHKIKGLVPSHGAILHVLYDSKESIKMMDLSKKIGKDKSTVTALVNKLSNLNYIKRLKSLDDSRITVIVLTQKGWDLQPIFEAVSKVVLDTIYTNFSQKGKEDIIEKLEQIDNSM